MKSLARSYNWCPSLDSDIERMSADCKSCQFEKSNPVKKFSTGPPERLFCGPFKNKLYLVVKDLYTFRNPWTL